MTFEVPTDLIRQVQIALRNEAGLSSYDPHDPTLPALPSLGASIAGLDPSPPYLRCKHCKGRLLRGLQSLICIYCGKQQRKDVLPEPIAFKSTFGYRWLLESLDLDGSDTIRPSIEGSELNRGQSSTQDKISLSEFLDLQITWPDNSENPETRVTNKTLEQSKSPLNLTGFDLDNYFSGAKRDNVYNASEEQPVISKQIESTESIAFASEGTLRLFQNVAPSETAARSSEDASGDTFSEWEADFQSADLGNQLKGSKYVDHLIGSTVDLSSHMNSVFGHGVDLKDGNTKDGSSFPPSMVNDLIQNGLWNNVECVVSQQAERFYSSVKDKDVLSPGNLGNPASQSVDWFQDNQWQINITSAPDNKTIIEDDDSFDEWNDFTSSTGAQDPSRNAWKQSGNEIAAVNERMSDINMFSSTNNFQEMDFSSFLQQDTFSGSSSNPNGSAEVNTIPSEVPTLDRIAGTTREKAEQATENGGILNSTTQPKDEVEMLISQMHDLSFMLESNLSVPSKIDGLSSFSQD